MIIYNVDDYLDHCINRSDDIVREVLLYTQFVNRWSIDTLAKRKRYNIISLIITKNIEFDYHTSTAKDIITNISTDDVKHFIKHHNINMHMLCHIIEICDLDVIKYMCENRKDLHKTISEVNIIHNLINKDKIDVIKYFVSINVKLENINISTEIAIRHNKGKDVVKYFVELNDRWGDTITLQGPRTIKRDTYWDREKVLCRYDSVPMTYAEYAIYTDNDIDTILYLIDKCDPIEGVTGRLYKLLTEAKIPTVDKISIMLYINKKHT